MGLQCSLILEKNPPLVPSLKPHHKTTFIMPEMFLSNPKLGLGLGIHFRIFHFASTTKIEGSRNHIRS